MVNKTACRFLSWIVLVVFTLSSAVQQVVWAQTAPAAPVSAAPAQHAGAAAGSQINLDLTSTQQTVMAGRMASSKPISIVVGGGTQAVTSASLLTPAERLAVFQVFSTGQQSIQLGAQGNAVGGSFNIGAKFNQFVNSLVIPAGVTAVKDFGATSTLSLAGNLTNAGTFYAISSNPAVSTAVINALNINNQAGALLTSILPSGGLAGHASAIAGLNLTLNAVQNIINSGVIASAGNLTAAAAGSIINQLPGSSIVAQNINLMSGIGNIINSGNISALVGNINITAANSQSILVNNTGGQMQALAGQINIRDARFNQKADLNLAGGNWIARELNLNSGQGSVSVDVGELLGTLNITAGCAHIQAASPNLTLGQMQISGDPSFFNTTGNVVITSLLSTSGNPLTIVAHSDIDFNSGVAVSSSGTTGGNIFMLAGANFSSSGSQQGYNDTATTLTIIGPVPGGGQINASNITSLTSAGTAGAGGNITLVAYSGLYPGAGLITLPSSVTVTSSGSNGASSGNVLIIGGATTTAGSTSITTGPVTTSGGSPGTGNITIAAATPSLSGNITVSPGGATSGGTFSPGTVSGMGITTATLTANGAQITLDAGTASAPAKIYVNGGITNNATSGNGGSVTINNGSGSTFTVGAVSSNGVLNNISVLPGSTGTGGSITINNAGIGGITITSLVGPANLAFQPTTGAGGSLTLNAGTGTLTLPSAATISTAGQGAGSYSGGTLSLTANSISFSSSGVLALNASGVGSGSGGQISVIQTGSSALTVGSDTGNISITTQSGTAGGAGGQVTVKNGGNLTVDPGYLLARPLSSGTGANIILTAGTAAAGGNLYVSGSIDASGVGTGAGGTVTLTSNSGTVFTVDSTAVINGVHGTIAANGTGSGSSGGMITVKSLGAGGVTVTAATNISAKGSSSGGSGGSLILDAGNGSLQVGAGTLSADAVAPGTYSGGTITLNGSTIGITGTGLFVVSANGSGGGNGGTINITAASGNFIMDTDSPGTEISATGGSSGSSTGDGGSVTVTSASGNIQVNNPAAFILGSLGNNGKGSSITLKAGTSGSGTVFVNGALSANGKGTGDAGSIDIESNSTSQFQVGTGAATNGVAGNVSAVPGDSSGATSGSVKLVNISTSLGGITLLSIGAVSAPAPASGGAGGQITLDAGTHGTLTVPTGTVSVNGSGASGNGGSLTFNANNLSLSGLVTLSAAGSGSGSGGTIQLTTAGTSSLSINTSGQSVEFVATGGTGGATPSATGDGGAVIVSNGGNIIANPAAISVAPLGNSGKGATISLTSGADLAVTDSIDASGAYGSGSGSGGGGSITLICNSSNALTLQGSSGPHVNGIVTANAGPAGGAGGTLDVENLGSGGVTITSLGPSVISTTAVSGHGGSITINGHGGALAIPDGTISANAVGSGNFDGGSISLSGSNLSIGSGGTLYLSANAIGSGNGGTVSAIATWTGSTIVVGTQSSGSNPGVINISATGGTGGGTPSAAGDGGIVTVEAGSNLTVDSASMSCNPQGTNGAGAQVTLAAGAAGSGTLLVSGNVACNGKETGAGGSFVASESSSSTFAINGGSIGTIKANAGSTSGTGGTISVTNTGSGGISLSATSDISLNPSAGGGAGGSLTLNASNGPLTIPAGSLSASAATPGNYNGGSVSLTGGTLTVTDGSDLNVTANAVGTGTGGSVSVTTKGATGDITAGTAAGNVNISASGGSSGSSAGDGGSVTLSAGHNLTVTSENSINVNPQGTNGKGGNITLVDGTAVTTATMSITGDLTANGAGTGSGGNISITYKDPTNAFQVGGTPDNSGITGNITADAPGSGTGGNITISNGSSAALNIDLANGAPSPSTIEAKQMSAVSTDISHLGNLYFNQSGEPVIVSGPGTLAGFVNSAAQSIDIEPGDTGTAVTVGSINATGGPATVTAMAPSSIVNIPLGHTASSTGNIMFASGTVYINGTVTTSNPGGTVLVQPTSGDELVSGQGLFQTNGGGATTIEIAAANDHTLTLDLSPTYNAGSGGKVIFAAEGSGGKIITTPGSNQIIASGCPTYLHSPSITMGDGAAFTALSNTTYTIDSGSSPSPALPLTITNSGASSRFITGGGAFNVGPNASGQPLAFANSSGGSSTMSFQGGLLTTTANGDDTSIASGLTIAANSNIVMNANLGGSITNNGTISNSAFSGSITINANVGTVTNNGTITNTGANSSILVQSNAGLIVGGSGGTFSDTGSGTNSINVDASVGSSTGNVLNLTGSQTFDPGSSSGTVAFSSPNCPTGNVGSINISGGVTETIASGAPVTFTSPIISFSALSAVNDTATSGTGITLNSCAGCSLTIIAPGSGSSATASTSGGAIVITPQASGNTYSLTFDNSDTMYATEATLNLHGGPVTTTTTYGGSVNADTTVNSMVTVAASNSQNIASNDTMTMNVNNASLLNNGTLQAYNSSGSAGRITIQSTGALTLNPVGGISVATSAASGAGGTINVLATSGALQVTGGGTLNADGKITGAGGNITVDAQTIAVTGTGSTLNLSASANAAAGGQAGGTILVKTRSATGDINITGATGGINATAIGAAASGGAGNGGTVKFQAGESLTFASDGTINVSAAGNGTGGTINLSASNTASAGVMTVNNALTANGAGSGTGGVISVISNSSAANALQILAGVTATGATGNSSAITIQNHGNGTNGGIQISASLNASGSSGGGGAILVDAGQASPYGPVTLTSASFTSTGVGTGGNGGAVTIYGSSITDATAAPSINTSASGTGRGGNVTLSANVAGGDISFTNGAFNLNASGSATGTIVSITAGRNLQLGSTAGTISANASGGQGGTVTIHGNAQTSNNGSMLVMSAVSANGTRGGSITLRNDSTGTLSDSAGVSATGSSSYGGSITIRNRGNSAVGGLITVGAADGSSVISANGANGISGTHGSVTVDGTTTNGGPVQINAATISADVTGTTGGYGTVSVTGRSITTLGGYSHGISANGALGTSGNGEGGTVTLTSTNNAFDVTLTGGAGGLTLAANGGVGDGNGGTIKVNSARSIFINSSETLSAAANVGGNGQGGTINLTGNTGTGAATSGAITVVPDVNVDGQGSGSGGTIDIICNSSGLVNVEGNLSANGGGTSGQGGTINVQNQGSGASNGGIDIGTSGSNSITANGNGTQGGTITIDASNASNVGTVTIDSATISAKGLLDGVAGGTISVKGGGISLLSGTGHKLDADAADVSGGSATGGTITLDTSTNPSSDITLSAGLGGLVMDARSGQAGGNGGTVDVYAGRGLNVATEGVIDVSVRAGSGTGGNINLTGSLGASSNGVLQVNATLAANGGGTGTGGVVAIINNSSAANALQIAASITATGASGNTTSAIKIQNQGKSGANGGIQLSSSLDASGSSGAGGKITLDSSGSPRGPITLTSATLTSTGSSSGNGGTISVTGFSMTDATAAPSINTSASGTGAGGNVTLDANVAGGDISFTNGSFSLNASGAAAGTTVNITAGRNMQLGSMAGTISANASDGQGGTVTIHGNAQTSNNGSMLVSSAVSANGTQGGSITLRNDSTGTLTVSAGVSATGSSSYGGSITIRNEGNSATGGLITVGAADGSSVISANGANGISGTHGSVTVDGTTTNGGPVQINAATISADVTGATGGYGNVSITGSSVSSPNTAAHTISAQGATGTGGSGAGGTVNITSTSSSGDITLDAGTGGLTVSANGGVAGGTGGTIIIKSQRSVSLSATVAGTISASALGGSSGSTVVPGITVKGSQGVDTGQVLINVAMSANGAGAGDGGSVTVIDNSRASNAILLQQSISANAGATSGKGGTISITNGGTGSGTPSNGGITLQAGANLSAQSQSGGTPGSITVDAKGTSSNPNGVVSISSVTFDASAYGTSGAGGTILVRGDSIGLTGVAKTWSADAAGTSGGSGGTGGTITMTALGTAGDVDFSVGPGITFNARGGVSSSTSGDGGTVNINAGRSLKLPAPSPSVDVNPRGTNGKGGAINLTAGNAVAGNLTVGNALVANGAGTGDGGAVLVELGTVGSGLLQVSGDINADGGATGNGGTVNIYYNDPTYALHTGTTVSGQSYVSGTISAIASGASKNGGNVTVHQAASDTLNVDLQGTITANRGSGGNYGILTFDKAGYPITVVGPGALIGQVASHGSSVTINLSASNSMLVVREIQSSSTYVSLTVPCLTGTIEVGPDATSLYDVTASSYVSTYGEILTMSGTGLIKATGASSSSSIKANTISMIGSSEIQSTGSNSSLNIQSCCASGNALSVSFAGTASIQNSGTGTSDVTFNSTGNGPVTINTPGLGTILATRNVGFYGGTSGTVNVSVNSISGTVIGTGGTTGVTTSASALTIGTFTSNGQTTYQTNGSNYNVTVAGTISNTSSTSGQNTVTVSASGNILESSGTVQSNASATSAVILSAAGSGGIGYNGTTVNAVQTQASIISATASNSTGAVYVQDSNSGGVQLGSTSPSYTNSAGTDSSKGIFSLTESAGPITIANNVTAGAQIILSANASTAGNIAQSGTPVLTAPSVSLTAQGATGIGTGVTAPVNINATTLTANAANGSSYVSDASNFTGGLTISSSSASSSGTFFFISTSSTTGAGNIGTSGTGIAGPSSGIAGTVEIVSTSGSIGISSTPITAKAAYLTLQATNSSQNVYVNDATTGTVILIQDTTNNYDNTTSGTYSVTANSATSLLTNTSGSVETVTAGTVLASATAGTIGTSCSSPFSIKTANITDTAGVSAFMSDSLNSAVVVSNSYAGTSSGNIFFLHETGTGGNITTSGTGITGSSSGTAYNVVLVSDNGSVGTSASGAGLVSVKASHLTFDAPGSGQTVYISDSASGTVTLGPCSGCGSSPTYDNVAGSTYNLAANSASSVVTASGETVTSGTVTVSATNGTIGTSCASPFVTDAASLTGEVAANSAYFSDLYSSGVVVTNCTVGTVSPDMFFLHATGSTGSTGSITTGGSGITGTSGGTACNVVLISDNGSVGTSESGAGLVLVKAGQLTLSAAASGQTVYVSDSASGTVTLAQCTGCGATYDNTASGTFNLAANSATSLVTGIGETVSAGTLTVSATSGTIGTSCAAPFATNTAALTSEAAANSAYFSDSYSSGVTVTNSTVGVVSPDMFFLHATGSTGNITTGGSGITGTSSGTAYNVVLLSDNGSIGTSASGAGLVLLNVGHLTLSAAASGQTVYVSDSASGTVTLAQCTGCGGTYDNSASGVFNLAGNSAGSVVTASGETVSAGTLTVSATSGTIGTSCAAPFATNTAALVNESAANSAYFLDLYSSGVVVTDCTVGTVSPDMFFLHATGSTGNITTGGSGITGTSGGTAYNVVLISDNGSVGTSASGAGLVLVKASQLTLSATASGQTVYVSDSASGTVTLAQCTGCGSTYDNTANGVFNLAANNASYVVTGSGETVTAGTLTVSATSGTIGTSCGSPFVTSTASLTYETAANSAFFSDSYSGTVTVTGASVGTATGDTFFLQATGNGGSIVTGETGAGITGTGGSAAAPIVVLVSAKGSIGTSAGSPAVVIADQITMQASASGQGVYVKDTDSNTVTLAPCSGCGGTTFDNTTTGTYSLTANSASSVVTASGEVVTAGTLTVSATSGTIGTSCAAPVATNTAALTSEAAANSAYFSDSYSSGVTVTNSTVGTVSPDMFFLHATGSTGNITTGGSGITGTSGGTAYNVVLISDNGSVGTSASGAGLVLVKASQLTLSAAASGQTVYVSDSASGTVTLAQCTGCGTTYDNTASGTFNLAANSASLLVTASGEVVTAGTVTVSATSGTIGASCATPFATNTAALTNEAAANSAYFSDSYSSWVMVTSATVGTVSPDMFFLHATGGTGNISTGGSGITGTSSGTACNVVLISDNGSVGTSASGAGLVLVKASQLTLSAAASGQTVYVSDSASGTVTLVQCKECGGTYDNTASGTFNLAANSASSVVTDSGEVVTAGTVTVSATSGTIGTSCANPFAVNTGALTNEVAADSAYFVDSHGSMVTVSGSTVGTVAGDMFFLHATGSSGTITTGGTGAGISGTGGAAAPIVVLVSDNGSIGTSASLPAVVNADQLTLQASASGQSVYVSDTDSNAVTLAPCSGCGSTTFDNAAGGVYQLTTTNASINVDDNINAVSGNVSLIAPATGVITVGFGKTISTGSSSGNISIYAETITNNGTISSDGAVMLTAATVNDNGTVIAQNGNLDVESCCVAGATLTINMGPNSSLISNTGNVVMDSSAPGPISIDGGPNHYGLIEAKNGQGYLILNGAGNPVNLSVGQVNCCIEATGSSIAATTYTGNLSFSTPIDTSSSTDSGGNVTLQAYGGMLDFVGINTSGSGPNNTAGNITIYGQAGINGGSACGKTGSGDLTAHGDNGAGGGTISITTPNTDPFTVGPGAGPNGVTGNIDASGTSGGKVIISTGGGLDVKKDGLITTNSTTGSAGSILIQLTDPGSKPLHVNNDGLITSIDISTGKTGLVGLNSGPKQAINLTGTGCIVAGQAARFGNMDPATLSFIDPPAGIIYLNGCCIKAKIETNGTIFVPPPAPSPVSSGSSGSSFTFPFIAPATGNPTIAALTPNDLTQNQLSSEMAVIVGNPYICAPVQLLARHTNDKSGEEQTNVWVASEDRYRPYMLQQKDEGSFMFADYATLFQIVGAGAVKLDYGKVVVSAGLSNVEISTVLAGARVSTGGAAIVRRSEDGIVFVSCLKGSVSVQPASPASAEPMTISPGQELVLTRGQHIAEGLADADGVKRSKDLTWSKHAQELVVEQFLFSSSAAFSSDPLLQRKGCCTARMKDKLKIQPVGLAGSPNKPRLLFPASGVNQGSKAAPARAVPEKGDTKDKQSSVDKENLPFPAGSPRKGDVSYRTGSNDDDSFVLTSAGVPGTAQQRALSVEQTFTTPGAVIKVWNGRNISVGSDGSLELKGGDALISASALTHITSQGIQITMKPKSVVYLSRSRNCLRVCSLHALSPGSVGLMAGNRFISLSAGQEAIAAPDRVLALRELNATGVGHRRIRFIAGDFGVVVCSEFSIPAVLSGATLLSTVAHSSDSSDKRLVGRILKTAACLSVVTNNHGPYSTGQ